jgi:Tfp pilus assembly protein PilX
MKSISRLFRLRAYQGRSSSRNRQSEGVALIIALLLLALMTVLGLGMVLAASSDALINGYYGNYRSAYYAADSGLKIARQAMVDDLKGYTSTTACGTWNSGSAPCNIWPLDNPYTRSQGTMTSLTQAYGSFTQLNGGLAANSRPSAFELVTSGTNPTNLCLWVTTVSPARCATSSDSMATLQSGCNASVNATKCVYQFQYNIVVLGMGAGKQQVQTTEYGFFTVTVTTNPGNYNQSFSSYGAFISNYSNNSSMLVCGTYSGPMWTNGTWNFGVCSGGSSYTFTNTVTQVGSKIAYVFNNGYVDSTALSASSGGQTIAPNFEQGVKLGATAIAMPTDSYSQVYAIIDGTGCGENGNVCGSTSTSNPSPGVPSASQMTAALETIGGTAYPSGGASTGVYMAMSGTPTGNSSTTPATYNGGGIYVAGDASQIVLSTSTDGSGNPTQVIAITQGTGSSAVTTTITLNNALNLTTLNNGGSNVYVKGVPHSSATVGAQDQTLLYVNGTIGASCGGWSCAQSYTGLSGPLNSETAAAIQNGYSMTVAAAGNIDVVGNLLYQSQTPAAAALSSTTDGVLGLYTNGGDINLYTPYNDNSLTIDAAMAMVGSGCSSGGSDCGIETLNSIGTFTVMGGRAEANAHGVNMSKSNTNFDPRFGNNPATGQPYVVPAWFPGAVVVTGIPGTPTPTYSFNRLNWVTTPQN